MYNNERFITNLNFILVATSYLIIVLATSSLETKSFIGSYFIAPFTIIVHLFAWFYPCVVLVKNRKLISTKKLIPSFLIALVCPVIGSFAITRDKELELDRYVE